MSNIDQILNLKAQVVTVPMGDVRLELNDDRPFAQIRGMNAVISTDARRDIIKLAGLDQNSIQTIRNTAGDRAANQILTTATKALRGRNVTLAFDGPKITRVVDPKDRNAAITPVQLVNMVSMLQEKGLSVWGCQISEDGTGANIQIVDPTVHDHPTMKDESVTIGRSFHWDALGGTSVNFFVQRMWCANGQTSNQDGRHAGMLTAGMDSAEMYKLLFIEKAETRLARHWERVQKLQETPMSVREFRELSKWLEPFDKDSEVFRNHLGSPSVEKMSWQKEYAKAGFNFDELSNAQLANAPTPILWWDGINTMTWLASHKTESDVSDWKKGQMLTQAGKFIGKSQHDADAWLKGLPIFN